MAIETRYRSSKPRFLDKIWVQSRREMGLQPNGYIYKVCWEDEEVLVKFHTPVNEGDLPGGDTDSYSFQDLEGNWTDRLGGLYVIRD